MKNLNFKMPVELGNECSTIDFMTEADYEICEAVQKFIENCTSVLGEECCSIMESAHRGLSHKMQLVLTHRLMDYLLYGSYSTTGVPHVDELLEKIIESIPKDYRDILETIWPEYREKKELRKRDNCLADDIRKQLSVVVDGMAIPMYERTEAKDFPLETNAKGFAESVERFLDKEGYELLVDSLRGLSDTMQYTMCMRIMDYFLFGVLIPTGINHVDAMIKELISKFPFDRQLIEMFLEKAD